MVFVYLGAVNRDPSRWSAPGIFAAGTERDGHMAFGFGVHTCIGAPLARLEAELGMAALLDRFERIAFGQERPHRLPSGVLFGFRSLHVVFA
jgi:cytochrome P450